MLIFAFSVGLVNKNLDLEATSLPISMSWMYVPMVLAGVVFAVQGAREIVEVLRRRKPQASSGAEPPVE